MIDRLPPKLVERKPNTRAHASANATSIIKRIAGITAWGIRTATAYFPVGVGRSLDRSTGRVDGVSSSNPRRIPPLASAMLVTDWVLTTNAPRSGRYFTSAEVTGSRRDVVTRRSGSAAFR